MEEKIKKNLFSGTVNASLSRIPESGGLTGWKYGFFMTVMVGSIGLALWPILIDPMLHIDKYKKLHEQVEKELSEVGLQPGQLKKFEHPWKRGM